MKAELYDTLPGGCYCDLMCLLWLIPFITKLKCNEGIFLR